MFVGEALVAAPAPGDRGLAYGDGLFETMRAHRGGLPWWPEHWARLVHGAGRLGIPLPAPERVHAEALALLAGGDGVLKLLLTRGAGGRGYAPPDCPEPLWMLARHPLPPAPPPAGLAVRWCDMRLATQPALAGIKHCNRLEQVLARAEWATAGVDEGLMRSMDGDVVCATAANLFVLHGGHWTTPPLDRCGVAGVCRQWLLQRFPVRQARLTVEQVETADAVVLCNAVRGILPVSRLGGRTWAPHPQVDAWRQALAAAHPGLAPSTAPEVS